MITALDHVALAVRDLDAAVDGYRRLLGVEPNWIGGDGGARHAWFQLPNMALDVIAPHGEGAFGQTISAHLDAHGEGVWALAFTVDDVEAAQKLADRRGLAPSKAGPVRSTHDDGRKRYWTTCSLDPASTGGMNVLLCAPPRDGQPWPQSQPTGDAAVTQLDHVVIWTADVNRALAVYGAKLGADLRLDRGNPQWDARQLFFKVGDAVLEIGAKINAPASDRPDRSGGLAWRVADPEAAQARMAAAGFDVSEVRTGRKPGTRVFTVRDAPAGVPTLVLSAEPAKEAA
jgi:catechol 2,3-dioxygenase-like lactoylglutathione lyase family enzyme